MNTPLDMLRKELAPFTSGPQAPETFSDPMEKMKEIRRQVEREHGAAPGVVPGPTILEVIERFRRTGTAERRDLKYVCVGIGFTIDRQQGWCVLADARLRKRIIELVEGQSEMRRRMRCFQALLWSYWVFPSPFPLHGKQTIDPARAGWCELRAWLSAKHQRIIRSGESGPPWLAALTRHAALLTDQPCAKIGAALLHGDPSELREAMESLAIPSNSWVPEEAVMAHLRAGCALQDDAFKARLPDLIPIGTGCSGIDLGKSLRRRGVALLVSRYAKCHEHHEHKALRDAAVDIIGNPWLQRPDWDIWVVDALGQPDNQSREMVDGWLKRSLITDFFKLLSADGMGDKRRVDYWLRFASAIEDMWFALGRNARNQRSEPFNDFRKRAKERLLDLDKTTSDNNAFVMRVGRHLLVEFGTKGNAMYVFEWATLGQPLLDTLTGGQEKASSVSIHHLKDRNHVERLLHNDSKSGPTWERKFDDHLVHRIGWRPSEPPYGVEVVQPTHPLPFSQRTWNLFAEAHGLRVDDNRHKQGALWVLGVEQPDAVRAQLEAWGFRSRAPRGWYYKE